LLTAALTPRHCEMGTVGDLPTGAGTRGATIFESDKS
jgi:hypothetical protein